MIIKSWNVNCTFLQQRALARNLYITIICVAVLERKVISFLQGFSKQGKIRVRTEHFEKVIYSECKNNAGQENSTLGELII